MAIFNLMIYSVDDNYIYDMDLSDKIKNTVESQFKATHLNEEAQIDAITHLMIIEIQCLATQYARYMVLKGGSADYSNDFNDFFENHYNNGA